LATLIAKAVDRNLKIDLKHRIWPDISFIALEAQVFGWVRGS
jgi:hypothetical protein